jgi:hypothetical protein
MAGQFKYGQVHHMAHDSGADSGKKHSSMSDYNRGSYGNNGYGGNGTNGSNGNYRGSTTNGKWRD